MAVDVGLGSGMKLAACLEQLVGAVAIRACESVLATKTSDNTCAMATEGSTELV